ncbi:MAG: hypothetical protein Q9163_004914 [Psora crenata]
MAAYAKGVLWCQRISEPLWHPPPALLRPCLRSSFSTTPRVFVTRRRVKKHDDRDAYARRQAKARKDANLSRQAVLNEERAAQLGDPIRGVESPFVKSFDYDVNAEGHEDTKATSLSMGRINEISPAFATMAEHLDHNITPEELQRALGYSRQLTRPFPPDHLEPDPVKAETERMTWEAHDRSASEAVKRIVCLANGSNMHRTKKNIERIINTFGRHNTEKTLKPKAAAVVTRDTSAPAMERTPRAGPDTGSSEVQIGILTAKIRVLADRYEGENRNDKVNKRNLRLLLHRRQKLLKYMGKKERGSERWQNMVETLGLTPATWQGQIAVE